MELGYKQQLEIILDKLAFTDGKNKSGWKFSVIDDFIIRFSIFGNIDAATYVKMSDSFVVLQKEYFKNAEYMILIFDFTNFKKATSDVRSLIIDGRIFKNEKISFVIYGINYFVSSISKIISSKISHKRLFTVNNEKEGIELANRLISYYIRNKTKELQPEDHSLLEANKIKIGGKPYEIISRQAWTYDDPSSDYLYKIDLVDDNILVSRPSGYIRYQNSIMANVLFDKVVNREVGRDKNYYRIQDYSSVLGSENKARRDFTDYIINEIDKINLLVFYGLNRTMKTVVRLGKLVHPAFVKVRIAGTFDEALELVIADKYKNTKAFAGKNSKKSSSSSNYSTEDELVDLKEQKSKLVKENTRYINILLDRISKITFGFNAEYEPVNIEENHLYSDLFSAIQLLHEDYSELKNDRDTNRQKLENILESSAMEIQGLKVENAAKLKYKENFIRQSSHELSFSLDAVLNAVMMLRQEEEPQHQKSLIEIINMAGIVLQDGIGELNSNITDYQNIETLSESMFNYRKNIMQLVEIVRIGNHNKHIIFENKFDEDVPAFLIGDKRKFNQITNIFLENALKYTNAGFIQVYTQVVNKTATQVRLRLAVKDSGIGIDELTKALIFQDKEIESEIANIKHKGFGLLIARNLAKVMDADIGFESEYGVGSKFWFEFTLNIGYQDKVSQMNAARKQRRSEVKKRLHFEGNYALLIMDDVIKQNLLEQMLLKKGMESRVKLNYELFEDIDGKFDFVFVCLQLIGGKEWRSFKLLKETMDAKNDVAKPIYIGCVSSLIDPILEEYRKAGVDYFLPEKCKITDLDQLLEDLK